MSPFSRVLPVLRWSWLTVLASLFVLLLLPVLAMGADPFTLEKSATYQYLCYKPAGYESAERVPMVIYLHGAGNGSVDGIQKWGPPSGVAAGKSFPFLLVAPISANGAWWNYDKLVTWTKEVIAAYKVDPDRVYLTGCSMGGFGSWGLGVRAPELFAAVVPICGGGDASQVWKLQKVPVWAYHGEKDDIVPECNSARLVEALRAAGGNVTYTIYPGEGHVCWPRVYTDEFYEKLLLLRRPHDAKPDQRAQLAALSADGSNLSCDLLMPMTEGETFPLVMKAVNRSTELESVLTVKLDKVDGISPGIREFSIAVPPGGSVQKEIPVSVNHRRDLPSMQVSWDTAYTVGGEHFSIPSKQEFELSRPLACMSGGPVTVDGDLSEWKGTIMPIQPQRSLGAEAAKDCSFGVGFRHDETNLYIAVEVTDADVVVAKDPPGWPSDDTIMVRLDAREYRPGILTPEDWRESLVILVQPGVTAGKEGVWDRRRIPATFVCVKTATGYAAEIAVPYKWMDAQAGHPWTSARLNVKVADRNAEGKEAQFEWFTEWRTRLTQSRSGTLLRR